MAEEFLHVTHFLSFGYPLLKWEQFQNLSEFFMNSWFHESRLRL